MPTSLPPVPALADITARLPRIFPEGMADRNYCVREMAARTVWVMFYAGAIEGTDLWIRPSMVTDMSDTQAALTNEAHRAAWYATELPDIILVDLGAPGGKVLMVFVEVVATDGPVNEKRKAALLQIAKSAKFDVKDIAFLSVFNDRIAPAFKRAVASLALGSFTWFMAEPDSLMILRDGKPVALSGLR